MEVWQRWSMRQTENLEICGSIPRTSTNCCFMEVLTVILFIATIVNFCYMVASLIGLKLDVKDENCAEDVAAARRTRNFIRFFPVFNVAIYVVLLVLASVCG